MSDRPPRKMVIIVGAVCGAGQHGACNGVSEDRWDDGREVWVCACSCHPREGELE